MQKINVVGTSGSGKSTLSRRLAAQLRYPYIEIDTLFWGKIWHETPDATFYARLERALSQTAWVLDGNYTRTNEIKWRSVDTIIWVDYSFPRTLYQAVFRAIYRAWNKVELWPGTGNRETFAKLFTSDSIIFWTLKTYRKNRRDLGIMMTNRDYSHIQFVRLRSPKACDDFINALPNSDVQ
ncbi:MAG: AAA family ATPase [Pseudomonadales bacterium]|nr:AAA family ATPase [Pseudomonadales bacterium]